MQELKKDHRAISLWLSKCSRTIISEVLYCTLIFFASLRIMRTQKVALAHSFDTLNLAASLRKKTYYYEQVE
jgi:hypothetical protein